MSYDSSASNSARPHHGQHSSPARAPALPAPSGEPLRGGTPPRPWTGHHRDLRILRRAYRRQRWLTTLAALGYFSLFLALSVGRPDIMARPVTGGLPTGLVLALTQLPVTWLAVALYERTARRHVDPLARRVNRQAPWAGGEQERER